MSREEMLRDYFRRYARVSLGPEPEKLADFYDTSFLAAGPKGGAAFKNDESFLVWLRELRAFNVKSGLISMAVDGIGETPVGGGYTLATVTWAATFQRTGDTPIRFSISYLLRESEASLKVAAYISHEDQEDAMRAHGLV
jgi:hypothetical protein